MNLSCLYQVPKAEPGARDRQMDKMRFFPSPDCSDRRGLRDLGELWEKTGLTLSPVTLVPPVLAVDAADRSSHAE